MVIFNNKNKILEFFKDNIYKEKVLGLYKAMKRKKYLTIKLVSEASEHINTNIKTENNVKK